MRRFAIIYVILALLIAGSLWDASAGGNGIGWRGGRQTDFSNVTIESGTAVLSSATVTHFTAAELAMPRYATITVFGNDESATTGDGKAIMSIPYGLRGCFVSYAMPRVTYTGTYTTGTLDIMITKVTLANAESTLYSMSVADGFNAWAVKPIDLDPGAFADGDYLRIDVDAIQNTTASKGLMIELEFTPPNLPPLS